MFYNIQVFLINLLKKISFIKLSHQFHEKSSIFNMALKLTVLFDQWFGFPADVVLFTCTTSCHHQGPFSSRYPLITTFHLRKRFC